MNIWYSVDGESYIYETQEEALNDIDYKVGDAVTIFRGELEDVKASHWFNNFTTQMLIEQLGENAHGRLGEAVDDWPENECSDLDLLTKELKAVIDKHIEPCSYKPVINPMEFELKIVAACINCSKVGKQIS